MKTNPKKEIAHAAVVGLVANYLIRKSTSNGGSRKVTKTELRRLLEAAVADTLPGVIAQEIYKMLDTFELVSSVRMVQVMDHGRSFIGMNDRLPGVLADYFGVPVEKVRPRYNKPKAPPRREKKTA